MITNTYYIEHVNNEFWIVAQVDSWAQKNTEFARMSTSTARTWRSRK